MTRIDWSDLCDLVFPAIPKPHEKPISTVEIWHAIERPKPSYHQVRNWLREVADDESCLLERIGGKRGAQWYRWKPV